MAGISSTNPNKQPGSQASQRSKDSFKDLLKEEGNGNGATTAPDLSDVRGFAALMLDIDQGSYHDGEFVREMFLNATAEYEGLVVRYFADQRQALIDGMNEKLSQTQNHYGHSRTYSSYSPS
ncbi:hypothetical protein HMPREF1544_06388 [Mucor circinelloides 1006PhL]|uniref:Uncharacterized protein n=1 Tax=Mucor circinelloides f. circinelloides (strain 1006PhL) TaxID=1220926 RepID=S2K3I8_MUCC1|nr:hypothetical protein HMPREF1544_06388 [Mucor circinelloides 1006PhL]KAG1124662.1 hypothetical protein G6F42_009420 [Rhizopus arrhizus]